MNLRNLFLQPKITYTIVKNPDKISLKKQFANSWKNPEIVPKQYSLTVKQRQNKTELPAVKALISDLKKISRPGSKILEIGCSTGYHSDYFKEAGLKVSYEGCDFSPAFIAKAKELHPDMSFKVSDATALDYKTGQFEVVISGCCILHILDYEKAIAETARVAKKM